MADASMMMRPRESCTALSGVEAPLVTPMRMGRSSDGILLGIEGKNYLVRTPTGHVARVKQVRPLNEHAMLARGVPGGVDYLMLFCVKHGWMSPLTEKRYNAAINVWVREPALMCTATFGYMQLHLQPEQVGLLSLVRVWMPR